MKTVELELAFCFKCPYCGEKNYVDSVIAEFSPEDQHEADVDFGITVKTGEWVCKPELVTCDKCDEEFEVEKDGEVEMEEP